MGRGLSERGGAMDEFTLVWEAAAEVERDRERSDVGVVESSMALAEGC